MKRKKLYILLFIGLLFIVGCGKKEKVDVTGKVINFAYSYSSTNGVYRDYTITSDGETVTINSFGNDNTSLNNTKTVNIKYIDEIEKMIDKYKMKDWNEFNKFSDSGIGFSLEIGYNDGNNIRATGVDNFPEGYEEFQKEFINFFNNIE